MKLGRGEEVRFSRALVHMLDVEAPDLLHFVEAIVDREDEPQLVGCNSGIFIVIVPRDQAFLGSIPKFDDKTSNLDG
ncbi:hypothetical protein [Hylemonella gracilis]|uniref:hypothetical protein n=1 Tax=Hylemonella gracilis TaxID=80880 RepID=UPI001110E2B4|nr:hypothetical protein [Hylemonella gracilis]